MKNILETEVIIIGAWPTGLMAASQLARFGIGFMIFDHKADPSEESRAMVMTARSLEIYQQMGLEDVVFRKGLMFKDIRLFIDGENIVDLSVDEAGRGLTDFPYTFTLEQSANENILYDTIRQHGKEVFWNTSFVSLEQDKLGVIARLDRNPGGEEVSVRAKYLIACDGGRSSVRRYLQCGFKGKTYRDNYFVADARVTWDQPYNKLVSTVSRKNLFSFFPMYGGHRYRISGVLPAQFTGRKDVPFSDLERMIRSTIQIPLEVEQVNWYTVYQLNNRCVDQLRVGNCFLAGDAAHVHSPAGGMGMNTGLQEAYNLAWKMALVLRGHAGERLLDSYHTERYPFAQWLLKYSHRIYALLTSRNPVISWLRLHLPPLVMKRMAKKGGFGGSGSFKKASQIWYNYRDSPLSFHDSHQKLQFKAGDRFPYIMVWGNDLTQSCYHLLTEAKFHLVIVEDQTRMVQDHPVLPPLVPPQLEAVIKVLHLPLSAEWELLGLKTTLYLLVRPDNYIAMISDDLNDDQLLLYFDKLKEVDPVFQWIPFYYNLSWVRTISA
ncbi:FAD-dependent monooxygenase [Pedobacter hartonius]|uniref:2-polyprenyl-6-methoxyphenol hydroxylase n=1 Tax=Pedobacter hartonius TaxID=425514 RepID=A0A1H4G5P7_9SPHI|nr:FAD-dependent monooxygenase [Pedobacter hartonius]SEB04884.1 2-polyprenyl-6-methoxyphenol hydroxylase [Pedobacter hartonius]